VSEQATVNEPEWQRVRREIGGGYLDPVDAETAHDVDYLMARLRKILDTAEKIGSLRWLPEDIEQLIVELRPHGRDGDAMFAELRSAHPKLFWHRTNGVIIAVLKPFGDVDPDELERCAAELGLTEMDRTPSGERDWRGTYADLPVRILGEADATEAVQS
jgi:hypothetical protein